jgi:hypothetical protein
MLAALAVVTTACARQPASAQADTGPASKLEIYRSPGKPGAPVALRYAVQGTPAVGKGLPVELTLIPNSRGSRLSVLITTDRGLNLQDPSQRFAYDTVVAGARFTHTVNVMPESEGLFYINVFVTLENEHGSLGRTFAVPIRVGEGKMPKAAPEGKTQTDPGGERVEVMPARESGGDGGGNRPMQ